MEPQNQSNEPNFNFHPDVKKNWFSRHMILGFVFLFAILAAIVAGLYYWQTVRQIPAIVDLPVHKVKVDPTATWQTYTNAQYGFEFKYPNDWNLSDESNADPNPLTKFSTVQVTKTVSDNDFSYAEFSSSLTEDSGIKNFQGAGPTMSIGGIDWNTHRDATGLGAEHKSLFLDTPYKNKFYTIELYPSDTDLSPVLTQILSTFKFTTPSIGTILTSKVYTNAKYGFQLTMPDSWTKYTVDEITPRPDDQVFPNTTILMFGLPLDHKLKDTADHFAVWWIAITPLNSWKKDACQSATTPGCDQGQELGRNSKYVFEKQIQQPPSPGSDCIDPNFKSQEPYLCSVYLDIYGLGIKDFKLLQ